MIGLNNKIIVTDLIFNRHYNNWLFIIYVTFCFCFCFCFIFFFFFQIVLQDFFFCCVSSTIILLIGISSFICSTKSLLIYFKIIIFMKRKIHSKNDFVAFVLQFGVKVINYSFITGKSLKTTLIFFFQIFFLLLILFSFNFFLNSGIFTVLISLYFEGIFD